MVEKFNTLLKDGEISKEELKELLKHREEKKIDFYLIDIREIYEYTNLSIVGTNYLFPTSNIHLHVKDFEKIKENNIILYCRSGNRTGMLLNALKRMGFEKVAHLSNGIIDYDGETVNNADLPS